MALKVEHELHRRRRGRNMALLWVLLGFVALVFLLTVVKVQTLGDLGVGNRMDKNSGVVITDPQGGSQ